MTNFIHADVSLSDWGTVYSRHLLDWIDDESFWLQSPAFAYELVAREPLQAVGTGIEIVGGNKAFEMASKLRVIVVVEAFDVQREIDSLDRFLFPLHPL